MWSLLRRCIVYLAESGKVHHAPLQAALLLQLAHVAQAAKCLYACSSLSQFPFRFPVYYRSGLRAFISIVKMTWGLLIGLLPIVM